MHSLTSAVAAALTHVLCRMLTVRVAADGMAGISVPLKADTRVGLGAARTAVLAA